MVVLPSCEVSETDSSEPLGRPDAGVETPGEKEQIPRLRGNVEARGGRDVVARDPGARRVQRRGLVVDVRQVAT